MNRCAAAFGFIASLFASAFAFAQGSPWTVQILPEESAWTYSDASDINDAGLIVGRYGGTSYRDEHALIWIGGTYLRLEDVIGLPPGFTNSVAWNINESRLIAGEVKVADGSQPIRAVLWDYDARTVEIIHPAGTGHDDISRATRVYEDGSTILSLYSTQGGVSQRGYYRGPDGVGNRLYEPPGDWQSCSVHAVNAAGTAVGFSYSTTPSYFGHAMAWYADGSTRDLHLEVAAALPPGEAAELELSIAYGSYADGTITGFARNGDLTRSYAWVRDPAGSISFLPPAQYGSAVTFGAGESRIVAGSVGAVFEVDQAYAAVWIDGILGVLPRPAGYGNMDCAAINSRGVVAGYALFEGEAYWYQGCRAFVAEPTTDGDFDGDALLDEWELQGYEHDNGAQVDLFGMGANPLRKDLFVEIDAMGPSPWDHMPTAETLQPVVDAFAAHGIALHVDLDDTIPFDAELGTLDGSQRYLWEEFDALKSAHFAEELGAAVRYCVFAHKLATLTDSGLARGEPSSDFIVSLGAFAEETGSIDPWMQAGTFMHELGHTLGLRHGGADVTNRKPNYLSVMNYDFQKQGLRVHGQDGHFDYSCCKLADLDEAGLLEGVGLGPEPLVSGYQTLFRILKFNPVTFETEVVAKWSGNVIGPIDWDDSGVIDATAIAADLNGNGSTEVLKGHDDWSALDFNGGTVGFGVGLPPPPPPPETEVVEELTVEEAKVIPPPPVEGLVGRAGRGSVRLSWTPVGPFGQATYRVYRWSATQERTLVEITQASLLSDRPGRGTWSYVVTVTDALGAESLDSDALTVLVR